MVLTASLAHMLSCYQGEVPVSNAKNLGFMVHHSTYVFRNNFPDFKSHIHINYKNCSNNDPIMKSCTTFKCFISQFGCNIHTRENTSVEANEEYRESSVVFFVNSIIKYFGIKAVQCSWCIICEPNTRECLLNTVPVISCKVIKKFILFHLTTAVLNEQDT